MGWEAHQIETLKHCITSGMSARETANLLQVHSRNAVLAKAFRMNLRFRSQPGHDPATRERRRESPHLANLQSLAENPAALLAETEFSHMPHFIFGDGSKPKRKPRRSANAAESTHVKTPYMPVTPLPPEFDSSAPRKTLETIQRHECHFPLDNAELGEFTYCGLPTRAGSAYCAHHYERMFHIVRGNLESLGKMIVKRAL